MALIWHCSPEGLAPELLEALAAAAAEFAAATADADLAVTSGRRTLRRQAELMTAMSDTQLCRLYARKGMPDYVQTILDRRAAGTSLTAEDVLQILRNRREGFISAHLSGAAADLALRPGLDLPRLRAILGRHGFDTLNETEAGIPCLHCRFRALPLACVRE